MNNPTITPAFQHLALSERKMSRLHAQHRFAQQHRHRFAQLSAREREVLTLVCQGLSNEEMASKLFLSVHTIRTHRNNIWRTLSIHTVVEAMWWAESFDLV